MKIAMKLIMISFIGIALHASEKLNPDKIIRNALATGTTIDSATLAQIRKQQEEILQQDKLSLAKVTIENYIAGKALVPERIIRLADAETATLAHQHNKSLLQQLSQKEQPK
jgi:hypothetical protein